MTSSWQGRAPDLAQELDSLFAEQLIVGEDWAGRHRADYVSAEIFRPGSRDGTASLRFVTDRLPLARPFRETGLILPSVIGAGKAAGDSGHRRDALDAVGATEGVFHVEMKTKSPVPEIIELNGRLGGFLARLVRYGTGERLGRLALSCLHSVVRRDLPCAGTVVPVSLSSRPRLRRSRSPAPQLAGRSAACPVWWLSMTSLRRAPRWTGVVARLGPWPGYG